MVSAPTPVVEAVLFDMGGPVARTPFEMLPYLERVCGAPERTFDWTGPFDPETDALWQRMQAGEITERGCRSPTPLCGCARSPATRSAPAG